MPSTHLHAINHRQEEPEESEEFPEHNNYNIMVNLAVVSSEFSSEDMKAMAPLMRLSETNPAHLLLVIFEDPNSAVAEAYVAWTCSASAQHSRHVRRGEHWYCLVCAATSTCEKGGQRQRTLLLLDSMRKVGATLDVFSFCAAISASDKGGQWQRSLSLFDDSAGWA